MNNLPRLTLTNDGNLSSAAVISQKKFEMDRLERKIVLNSGMLINKGDSLQKRSRKIADCLADAMGLTVDCSCLFR